MLLAFSRGTVKRNAIQGREQPLVVDSGWSTLGSRDGKAAISLMMARVYFEDRALTISPAIVTLSLSRRSRIFAVRRSKPAP